MQHRRALDCLTFLLADVRGGYLGVAGLSAIAVLPLPPCAIEPGP
jgi:hypothetical protein